MSNLTWQDPPPSQSGRGEGKWADIAAELRSRPGQWALVASGANSTQATYIKQGRLIAFQPAGTFEAVSRRAEEGRDIYARFIGSEAATSPGSAA